ncbi:PucR family transcriptional regulator [Gracilibacillus sp. HCP3S3_G5_1]|uniref:PucR family transcriptional regulator n=1 Tax=unclassified Gracilibacillus TaxID=2625209 RepID=UPI003F8C31BD
MKEIKKQRGLTLRDLLKLEPLKGAQLVAAVEFDKKMIDRINIMGSPEVDHFVRPNEFILTTGYPFRDNPEDLIVFLEKLVEKGVAGIGIKIKRFITEIPNEVLKKAEELHFPIVEIQPTTVFSDVVRVAMEEIFYRESEHFVATYNRLQKFTNSIVEGEKLEDVLAELEQELENPLIIKDLTGDIVAPLLSNILNATELADLANVIEGRVGTGSFQVELREEIFVGFGLPLSKNRTSQHIPYIACIETNHHLTDVDFLTLEKISTILLMELTHIQFKEQMEEKYLSQFVKSLLRGDEISIEQSGTQSEITNVALEEKWLQVCILQLGDSSTFVHPYTLLKKQLNQFVSSEVLVTEFNGQMVMLVADREKQNLHVSMKIIENEIGRFISFHEGAKTFTLLIGNEVNKLQDVYKSYQQALQVRKIYQQYNFQKRSIYFSDMHIYRLLYLLPETEEIPRYIADLIGPLLEHPRKDMLIETLETYFAKSKNIRATADHLFTHYNTVVYRLERIKELLGLNIDDPEISLELQITLKIIKN